MDEFYILLNSNASKDVCADNLPTSFRNIMPSELILDDNWKVSLQSICMETSFSSNVPKEVSKTKKHLVYCTDSGWPLTSITIPDGNYTKSTMFAFLETKLRERMNNKKVIGKTFGNGKFSITLTACQFLINRDVCEWLNINTEGKQTLFITGLDWMISSFDPLELNKEYTSNSVAYVQFIPDQFLEDNRIIFNTKQLPIISPEVIKVLLEEIKQGLSASGNHRDLAIIPFNTSETDSSFYHEVIQKEYFPLASNLLQNLTVKLVDEDGDELQVLPAHPTFIKLKFKNMSSQSFILRLSSKDSTDIYTDNTASNFRIQLPRLMMLTGNRWEVALSTINFPSRISIGDYLSHLDLWIEIETENGWNEWGLAHTINLKNNYLSNYEELQAAINDNTFIFGNIRLFEIFIDKQRKVLYNSRTEMRIRMSPMLATILGANNHLFATGDNDRRRQIGTADIQACLPNAMSLYSDFTSPIIAGGKYCKMLKFIPLLRNQLELPTVSYESQHMDFVNLPTTELQSLQFDLRDGSGIPLKFQNNKLVTYVNLLFRKII